MAFKHGGDIFSLSKKIGLSPEDILDLSSNVVERSPVHAVFLSRLPPEEPVELEVEIERFYGFRNGTVLANAGSSQIIKDISFMFRGGRALIFSPTYTEYERFLVVSGVRVEHITADETDGFRFRLNGVEFDGFDLVFLCNPNNPTGSVIERGELYSVIKENPETLFVLDESYMDFDLNRNTLLGEDLKNLCVIRSFSKLHGLSGLRVGWLYSPNKSFVEQLSSFRAPWSLTEIAISKAKELISREYTRVVENIISLRESLIRELSKFKKVKTFESRANFVLFKLMKVEPSIFSSYFENRGILLRNCADFHGLDDSFFRVSVKSSRANEIFLDTVKSFFNAGYD